MQLTDKQVREINLDSSPNKPEQLPIIDCLLSVKRNFYF